MWRMGTADGSVLPKTDAVTCSGPTSLTPPASPLDPNSTDVVTGPGNLPPASNLSSVGVIDKKKLTQSLVQEVWQEITVTKPAELVNEIRGFSIYSNTLE